MTTKYRIRALAQADLESIWLYTCEQWSVTQADTYVEALIQRFDWLAENPTLGKPRDDVKQGYFFFQKECILFSILSKITRLI
jgi:toxin ParE1/3/4